MQRTVGRHIRGLDEDDLTHLDRILLALRARFKPWARLTRGLKTETGVLNFVCLMARGMA